MAHDLTRCYVDESVHAESGFVTTSFVFGSSSLEDAVARVLEQAGLTPREEELKSSARMDADSRMRAARDAALGLARSSARIAIFVGPYDRSTIGKQCLQALQSVILRNGLPRRRSTSISTKTSSPRHRRQSGSSLYFGR